MQTDAEAVPSSTRSSCKEGCRCLRRSGVLRHTVGAHVSAAMPAHARKRAVMYFGSVFSLISSGSPHVRCTPMWALSTCGEPDEIGLSPTGVELNGSRRVPASWSHTSCATSGGQYLWSVTSSVTVRISRLPYLCIPSSTSGGRVRSFYSAATGVAPCLIRERVSVMHKRGPRAGRQHALVGGAGHHTPGPRCSTAPTPRHCLIGKVSPTFHANQEKVCRKPTHFSMLPHIAM